MNVPLNAKLLLSVGELNRNKNHEVVIHALAELAYKNVHYLIAGTGGMYGYLRELSEKLEVSERVHELGYRDDVVELYRMVDVYVLPSLREGLNVSLMEAMSCGLPVICAKIRGNVDLVKDTVG